MESNRSRKNPPDKAKASVEATVKAVIERTDGKRLQVDFGKDEIALVHLWQVVEKA